MSTIPAVMPEAEQDLRLELVEGLHCASCVARAEKTLHAIPGVSAASVNLATREALVRFSPASATIASIKTRLADAGFVPQEVEASAPPSDDTERHHAARRRAVIAAVLATPVVVLGMGHLHADWSLWTQLLLTTAVLAGPAHGLLVSGMRGLVRLRPDMDALVSLGAIAAFTLSLAGMLAPAWWPGMAPIHFESSAALTALVLVGRWLEERGRARTGDALHRLLARRPPTACRITAHGDEQVLVRALHVDDQLRIHAGEAVPVDGEVTTGDGHLDEALITGESLPAARTVGNRVIGGTTLLDGTLVVRVTAIGENGLLARLAAQVRRAQGAKPPIAQLADRLSAWFVPAVVALAIITVVVWRVIAPDLLAHAVLAGASVLVIACPCALGLATPIAIMAAVGRAAELGLLVRNGAALEGAGRIDTVALDKTGTLTLGVPTVSTVLIAPGYERDEVLRFAAAVEAGSEHPLARALLAATTAPPPANDFRNHPGLGVEATVNGRHVAVGSARFLRSLAIDGDLLNHHVDDGALAGTTAIFVAIDRAPAGLIAVADTIRPDAADAVASLHQRGITVVMLTGDNEPAARRIAALVGITDVRAGLLPADKLAHIHALQAAGHRVAMVGDGVNDAPALAAANLGVAMAGANAANAVAAEAGDVVLLNGRLAGVATLLALARATMRTVHQNLAGALGYNLLAIPLAAGVFFPVNGLMLDPMIAGAAMAMSSLTVVANGLRLHRFRP